MPWEKLCEIMHSYTTVVLMPMEKELRRRIMDDCFWHGIAIMLKPDMQDIMVNCADTVIMSDVPLCAVHTGNYDRGYLTAKRVLDMRPYAALSFAARSSLPLPLPSKFRTAGRYFTGRSVSR